MQLELELMLVRKGWTKLGREEVQKSVRLEEFMNAATDLKRLVPDWEMEEKVRDLCLMVRIGVNHR